MIVTPFFETADEFAAWLEKRGAKESQLIVGYYKRGTKRGSITWPESVDAALCFGWIDGVRRRIDDASYSIRFTPRKKRRIWSAGNIKSVEDLAALGLIRPAGVAAFEARAEERSRIYSFEQKEIAFDSAAARRF